MSLRISRWGRDRNTREKEERAVWSPEDKLANRYPRPTYSELQLNI